MTLTTRDGNRIDRPTGAYDRSGQTFFLDREDLDIFLSLFSLKGQATCP